MTEAEAKEKVRAIVGPDATTRLETLAALVLAENTRQNLIAPSTVDTIWSRHILDSVQLLRWYGNAAGPWLDIGTGGGFPGLAVATAYAGPIILSEPRARRAAFLRETAAALALQHVVVYPQSVDRLAVGPVSVISARAVAPPEKLVRLGQACAGPTTRWLLQRGSSWHSELTALRRGWTGTFHVEHSLTNVDARIVIVSELRAR